MKFILFFLICLISSSFAQDRDVEVVTISSEEIPPQVEDAANSVSDLIKDSYQRYRESFGMSSDIKYIKVINILDSKSQTPLSILSEMNPHRDPKKLEQEVLNEYESFKNSVFYRLVKENDGIFKLQKVSADLYLQSIFDEYMMLRFGFAVEQLQRNLNTALKDAVPLRSGRHFMLDNAYLQTIQHLLPIKVIDDYLKIFLNGDTEIELKPVDLVAQFIDKNRIFRYFYERGKIARLSQGASDRLVIVLLPRSFQKEIGWQISTIFSDSVVLHEYVHGIIRQIEQDPSTGVVGRTLHELFSDYFPYWMTSDPKIGKHFAESSGAIASYLENYVSTLENLSLEKRLQYEATIDSLKELADSKSLRDLSQPVHLDEMPVERPVGPYEGNKALAHLFYRLTENEAFGKKMIGKIIFQSLYHLAPFSIAHEKFTQASLRLKNLEAQLELQKRKAGLYQQQWKQYASTESFQNEFEKILNAKLEEKFGQEVDKNSTKYQAEALALAAELEKDFENAFYRQNALKLLKHFRGVQFEIEQENAQKRLRSKTGIKTTPPEFYLKYYEYFQAFYASAVKHYPDSADAAMEEVARLLDRKLVFIPVQHEQKKMPLLLPKAARPEFHLELLKHHAEKYLAVKDQVTVVSYKEQKMFSQAYYNSAISLAYYQISGSKKELTSPNKEVIELIRTGRYGLMVNTIVKKLGRFEQFSLGIEPVGSLSESFACWDAF